VVGGKNYGRMTARNEVVVQVDWMEVERAEWLVAARSAACSASL